MITWKKQGEALVGSLALKQGGKGSIIVVGPASNPNGATLVTPGEDPKKPHTSLLPAGCEFLTPGQYLEILCMQERGFGTRSFPALTGLD
ncbi:MAG: hypothetical protein JNK74_16275 [Candidatus Hydrogenedentes bacterium]|nr:hypothetical protein [Candidatus Hydrogenedentota bacterium]